MKEKETNFKRMNIRLPEHIQDYYKSLGEKYSVPYTNYISMVLTQVYENEQSKILLQEFNETLKSLKMSTGDVTAEEMINQLQQMKDMVDRLENKN